MEQVQGVYPRTWMTHPTALYHIFQGQLESYAKRQSVNHPHQPQ